MRSLALALAVSLAGAARAADAPDPVLEFRVGGRSQQNVPLQELKAKLEPVDIRLTSRFSKKEKRYQAFRLQDVLQFAYGNAWRKSEYSDVAFIALDGYESVGGLAKLGEEGGYLAFRDLDRETGCPKGLSCGWEPVGDKKADPGPFFLVWTHPEQSPENSYPWPWQVKAVNLIRFEDQYPAVVPKNAKANSPAQRGFAVFRGRCLRCHSMNLEGGKIGPDLDAPRNITTYRPKGQLKEFIRHPSKFRHSQMPDHPDLSDRDLEDLWEYLRHQAKARKPDW